MDEPRNCKGTLGLGVLQHSTNSGKLPDLDLIVIGDEVESVITAVSAARCGLRVAVIRYSESLLGGLCTRAGLNYMDITPEYTSPMFAEFLAKADVKRVALDADKGHRVLQELLGEAGVRLISGVEMRATYDDENAYWQTEWQGELNSLEPVTTRLLIDATPDADIARQLELPYTVGLGGIFGDAHNFLGVSPVFRMRGVDRQGLINFERLLRERLDMFHCLEKALPHHPLAFRRELIERPVYSPDDMDYIDILNPVIGIAFHHWCYGEVDTYPNAPVYIDGFNTARLSGDMLGFNGLVMRMNDFDALLAYSHGDERWPEPLVEALQDFPRFLREEGGFAHVDLVLPEELYVRQTLNMHAQTIMTAEKAIRGGVPEKDAIGTFSYWLDLRGVTFTEFFKNHSPLPKPVFNVGLGVCFPANPAIRQFAFVGRSAGYSPIGQGACRIVQHNAMLGEALGVSAALAIQGDPSHCSMKNVQALDIRETLAKRWGKPIELSGHATWPDEAIQQSSLIQADNQVVERTRIRRI